MNCLKCSREAPADALYCPYCGSALSQKQRRKGKPRTRPNGTGTAIKRGSTWTARVVAGWVKTEGAPSKAIYRTKGGFKSKREALDYCQTLIKGVEKPREKIAPSLRDVYDQWLPSHEGKVSKATMDCYKAAWKYFTPLHDIRFDDLDLDDLQECVDECPMGRRTKENMKALMGLLMKYGIPRHYTDMNYAEYIDPGHQFKGTRPAFTAAQVAAIRAQIGVTPHAEDVYCLIYTGFRPNEFFALTKASYKDGVLYGGSKTQAGKDRAVPVHPGIAQFIRQRLEADCDVLFPNANGGAMTGRYFRENYFYPVIAAAGIQPIPTKEKPAVYVPYSCRHTFANFLKNVNGADRDKAALIGHEDYRTTKKVYQSAELEALKAIIQEMA